MLSGLPLIEVLGEEGRDRAARAARVERVEGAIERQQIRPEGLDLGQGRRGEPKRLRRDPPGDGSLRPVGDAKEARRQVLDDVATAFYRPQARDQRSTGQIEKLSRMSGCRTAPPGRGLRPTSERPRLGAGARARASPSHRDRRR